MEAWKGLPAARGDYLEPRLLDSTWHPQGMALVRVEEREDPARYGEWLQGSIVAVSDAYTCSGVAGPGRRLKRAEVVLLPRGLLLAGAQKGTPTWSSFHLESLRSIPLVELGTSQQPAWLVI